MKAVLFTLLTVVHTAPLQASHIFSSSCALTFINSRAAIKNRATRYDISLEEFRNIQRAELVNYKNVVIPDMLRNPSPLVNLPKGIKQEFAKPIEELWRLAKHPTMYFELAQPFELSVFNRSQQTQISLEQAFFDILSEQENYYGFEPPVIVTDLLKNGQFLMWVNQGRPIADEYYRGRLHTIHGHRVQSLLQAIHLEKVFGDKTLYSKIYRYMGEAEYLPQFDWTNTGFDLSKDKHPDDAQYFDLFGYLYDTPFHSKTHKIEPSDFTNPEFFGGMRLFLPALVGWD